jgi:hypothetical protein
MHVEQEDGMLHLKGKALCHPIYKRDYVSVT